jgi:hypothetical protein
MIAITVKLVGFSRCPTLPTVPEAALIPLLMVIERFLATIRSSLCGDGALPRPCGA